MGKSDLQLKTDIEEELRWDPMINEAAVDVAVKNGKVVLMGTVDTYAEKWAAEDATRRVSGVRGVTQDLKVTLRAEHARSDADLKGAIDAALKWNVFVPTTISAKVTNGAVTLEGSVGWNYQRDFAERSIRYLSGVNSVTNLVALNVLPTTAVVKEKVAAALKRQAMNDAASITIETTGRKVTLSGHASSWQSIEDATQAAWAAPGVNEVVEHIALQ
jgi:osmotically-inducible protein OsmY